MVATKSRCEVATLDDVLSPVDRGLNRVKGYFHSKISYGKDGVTTPLKRMRAGQFHKDGEFTPVTWDQAFDVTAE